MKELILLTLTLTMLAPSAGAALFGPKGESVAQWYPSMGWGIHSEAKL